MTRPLLLVLALSSFGCGSRVLFFPSSMTAEREGDGKVLVTARMGLSLLGTNSSDLAKVTELCMRATWSETVTVDAGTSDGGSDAGTSDAGVVGGADGGVTVLSRTAVGATLSTASQCQPGTGGTFELRSSETVPLRPVIVTLTPFESDASRAKRSDGVPPVQFDEAQFFSP